MEAVPHSLRDLIMDGGAASLLQDPRTPSQLFCNSAGDNTTVEKASSTSWLSPLSRCMTPAERLGLLKGSGEDSVDALPANNTMFVLFNHPVKVAAIR